MLQWSHVLPNVETGFACHRAPAPASFNGATSFRTWKRKRLSLDALDAWASMEPRPSERGNSSGTTISQPDSVCFNGATSFRTWKQQRGAGDRHGGDAS